jgi:hypothetical protein
MWTTCRGRVFVSMGALLDCSGIGGLSRLWTLADWLA